MTTATGSTEIVDSLTAALAESNDLLASMYSLTKSTPEQGQGLGDFWSSRVLDVIGATGVILQHRSDWFASGDTSSLEAHRDVRFDEDLQIVRSKLDSDGGDILNLAMPRGTGAHLLIQLPGHCSTSVSKLARSVANYVDAALATADVHELEVANRQMSRDIEMAAAITDTLIPRWTPELPGWDLYANCEPARMASGDFYTFSITDSSVIAAIGDVSGKGIPAAVAATVIVTSFGRLARKFHDRPVSELAAALNAETAKFMNKASVFSTLCLIKGDFNKIQVCNLGHSPVMAKQNNWQTISPHSPPLGVVDEIAPGHEEYAHDELSALLVASDGLVEQTGIDGEQLGYEGFYELISAISDEPSRRMSDAINAFMQDFAKNQPQDDDRTLMILERAK